MLNVEGASEHTLGAQGPGLVDPPLQFPSVPTYKAQELLVPVYEEHVDNVFMHPYPVVTQPLKKLLHP